MPTKPNTLTSVFVGMSGGVDSAVSAALLKRAGYAVTGVFIKVWSPDWLPCDWREERRDAMRAAAHLDIPFLTFDFEDIYKKSVVDYLLAEYKSGRTPNPDVLCNREVKFGAFLREARRLGADFIATGHYAQNIRRAGTFHLLESPDAGKDQSYFLWTLGQEELAHALFPVGHMKKEEVRALANKFGLPNAAKKDSQGICFLGPVDMKEFLAHYVPPKPGMVIDMAGRVIGEHPGALFFTLGERHGFSLHDPIARSRPHYILAKNIDANTLTVAPHESAVQSGATRTPATSIIESVHWTLGRALADGTYLARYRYHQQPQACRLRNAGDHFEITFQSPQETVSAGQSLVLYAGEECLGGGIVV